MDGVALAASLRRRHPALRVLFVSGYGPERLRVEEGAREGEAFLPKPFSPPALRRAVRSLLDG